MITNVPTIPICVQPDDSTMKLLPTELVRRLKAATPADTDAFIIEVPEQLLKFLKS
jgi:hypothetical protein